MKYNRLLIASSILSGFVIGILLFTVAPLVATPKFIVINESRETVAVQAHWRETIRDLGDIPSNGRIEFEVNDEASMNFVATFPNGEIITSSPAVYFTSGTVTYAVISTTSVDVSTEL